MQASVDQSVTRSRTASFTTLSQETNSLGPPLVTEHGIAPASSAYAPIVEQPTSATVLPHQDIKKLTGDLEKPSKELEKTANGIKEVKSKIVAGIKALTETEMERALLVEKTDERGMFAMEIATIDSRRCFQRGEVQSLREEKKLLLMQQERNLEDVKKHDKETINRSWTGEN